MARRHPYRSNGPPHTPPPQSGDRFEERILAVVLVVAGLLGTIVGASAPRANATELVFGAFLLVVGLWTLRHSRAEPVV